MEATDTQVVGRGVSPAPVQLWQRWAQSRCKCGSAGPSPGADVRAVGAVPVQMRPMAATDLRQLWRDRIRNLLILRVYVAAELEPIGEALPRSLSRPPVRQLFGAALCAHAEVYQASVQLARRMHASVPAGSGRTHTHGRVTVARGRRGSARARESGQARRAGANSPVSVQVWRG